MSTQLGTTHRGPARPDSATRPGSRYCDFLWAAATLALAGCVSAPTSADWMAIGYRTPLQTLRTFQTAMRAEEPDLELRCFSSAFRARNHISRLNWREFLEQLEKDEPFLRKGIVDAEIDAPVERHGDRARIRLATHGVVLEAELVLEDFGQVWEGERLRVDEDLRFTDPDHLGIQDGAGGSRWIYGRLALPAGVELTDITEMRLAREWKIDGIETLGEASGTASSARAPPR